MDLGGVKTTTRRMVGDYIIGPKIGSGSFAVVYRSQHRHLGTEFAIKEIEKKHLNDNLLKEISILSNINHPNIIRLFEAIQTEERIYLVLEYCDGGDLGEYINRHGRVSEDVARHLMKQLATGLQVLRENHLIHRDLKPQNLLLASKKVMPLLKIGDFGFARYLTPQQDLAATLCGSPLYMAPEIILNQKYDAKADLWSVGAILYQLVIGKPPFDGNCQLQLFQNVLKASDLQFPDGATKVLHSDCIALIRSLLRRNPVERITSEEFFNHKFLVDSRVATNAESSSQITGIGSLVLRDDQRPQLNRENKLEASAQNVKQECSSVGNKKGELWKDRTVASSSTSVHRLVPSTTNDKVGQSLETNPHSLSKNTVADSLESIEKGYVLVHSNVASMEILTSSLGTSLIEGSSNTVSCALAPNNVAQQSQQMPIASDLKPATMFGSGPSTLFDAPYTLGDAQDLSVLHPSTKLQLLHRYVDALSDLAQEKLNANFFLESFSIELVVLAIWKEVIRICNSWLSSSVGSNRHESSSRNEITDKGVESSSKPKDTTDFTNPSSVSMWAEQGFIVACDRAEKLLNYLQDLDGGADMPDAMEIIYQTALTAGRNGAADEYIGNQESATTLYSKALLLFQFIVAEAPSLLPNPPFSLEPENKLRILKYIKELESHLN